MSVPLLSALRALSLDPQARRRCGFTRGSRAVSIASIPHHEAGAFVNRFLAAGEALRCERGLPAQLIGG